MNCCTAGSDIAVTAARAEQPSPRAQLSAAGPAFPRLCRGRAPSLESQVQLVARPARARAISTEQGPAPGCSQLRGTQWGMRVLPGVTPGASLSLPYQSQRRNKVKGFSTEQHEHGAF